MRGGDEDGDGPWPAFLPTASPTAATAHDRIIGSRGLHQSLSWGHATRHAILHAILHVTRRSLLL